MDEDARAAGELRDAALVRAARRNINEAITALATSPLDEATAEQMRQALGVRTAAARAALQRLRRPRAAAADVRSAGGAA